MNDTLLEARHLTKRYGKTCALDDCSVAFRKGVIYGLLGRNGAGKTTLLNLLTSRIYPDAGSAVAFGEDVAENTRVLPRICYMPEKNLFMRNMTVKTELRAAAEFFGNFDRDYASRLCELFSLDTRKRYKELSRGYESIFRIVIGLAARAEVTVFDEPVLGLDAAVRDIFYSELLADFSAHPRTFIISTHLIEESAELFEEAVILKEGRLIERASVEELKSRAFYLSGRAELVDRVTEGLRVLHTERVANMKICAVYQALDESARGKLIAEGLELSAVPVQKLFIYLTNPDERSHHHEENDEMHSL